MGIKNAQQVITIGENTKIIISSTSDDVKIASWERPELSLESSPDQVSMEQDAQGDVHIRPLSGNSGSLKLQVPTHCSLDVQSVSGDVKIREIDGNIRIQTMSGDIKVHQVRGNLHTFTVSGDVVIKESALSELTLESVSGGGVIESSLAPEGEYSFRTVSGDLVLAVPEDQACTIHYHTMSGDIRSSLPHEILRKGWGRIEAEINGGGVGFDVKTASGDVRVEAAGNILTDLHAPSSFSPKSRDTEPLHGTEDDSPFQSQSATASSDAPEKVPVAVQRMHILKAIEEGSMTVEEGLAKLRNLT